MIYVIGRTLTSSVSMWDLYRTKQVATVASPWRGMPLDPSRPYPLFSLNPHHSRPRVAMSRAHKSNMAPPQNMGPPQDVVMGPPPLPPQVAQSTSQKSNSTDVVEKYRRLKRKYFDLEEVSDRVVDLLAYQTVEV